MQPKRFSRMDDVIYREEILEHWENPRNYGVLKGADVDASENNPVCGDKMRMMAKIKNNKIEKISFVGEGCAISIASASQLTGWVKGMEVGKIAKMKPEVFLEKLGMTLSPARIKCALLGFSTLKKAIKML
jgi:nitrogen fixation protein NifU and related proteins